MNQKTTNQAPVNHPMVNDELDIKKLFITLWQRKWIVVITTFILAIGTYALSFLITPVWTSTAIMMKPSNDELGNFSFIEQTVTSLDLSNPSKETALSINDAIYRQFIETVASYDFKREFWSQSDYYLQEIKGLKNEHEKSILLERLINNIQFIAQDERKGTQDSLLLRADTAHEASALLRSYIAQANQNVIASLMRQNQNANANLKINLTNTIAELKNAATTKFAARLELATTRLKETHDTYAQLSTKADVLPNEIELVRLTFDQLNNELAYLKASGPEYDPRIEEYTIKLNGLKTLPEIKEFKQTFKFLRTPYDPISPDSPRRVFWAFLAALLGGFIGVCIALIKGPKSSNS